MLKKEIRKQFLEKRVQLSEEEFQDKSASIVNNFRNLDLPVVNFLLSYAPLMSRKEFDVSECGQIIREKNPSVKVAWPKADIDMNSMEAQAVEKDGLFIKNKFNILEPLDGEVIPPHLIDVAFVPLIAFDINGYRVGYGKGFYDKYLLRCRTDCVKLGFSFFEALSRISDITDFDVPLNLCITPSRIYEF